MSSGRPSCFLEPLGDPDRWTPVLSPLLLVFRLDAPFVFLSLASLSSPVFLLVSSGAPFESEPDRLTHLLAPPSSEPDRWTFPFLFAFFGTRAESVDLPPLVRLPSWPFLVLPFVCLLVLLLNQSWIGVCALPPLLSLLFYIAQAFGPHLELWALGFWLGRVRVEVYVLPLSPVCRVWCISFLVLVFVFGVYNTSPRRLISLKVSFPPPALFTLHLFFGLIKNIRTHHLLACTHLQQGFPPLLF